MGKCPMACSTYSMLAARANWSPGINGQLCESVSESERNNDRRRSNLQRLKPHKLKNILTYQKQLKRTLTSYIIQRFCVKVSKKKKKKKGLLSLARNTSIFMQYCQEHFWEKGQVSAIKLPKYSDLLYTLQLVRHFESFQSFLASLLQSQRWS